MTSNDVISATVNDNVVSKAAYRFKVWNLLENKDLVNFPRPCKGRIPNFVDNMLAAAKLSTLEVFKKAEVVKVNMDKPQEMVRFTVLEEGKTLVISMARLSEGVLTKIIPPEDATRSDLTFACKSRAISKYGKAVGLDEKIHVDLVVMGSVAVSKEGHRIGKGEGFSDLEFALMAATGTVDENTVVVTTVHDEQVFDTLPHELFQSFDVPVDYIVTPTQVIEVTPRLPKPQGIIWGAVSDRRLQLVPVLKTLRDKEIESGKECPLKDVDSEPEERIKPYFRRPPPYRRRPPFNRQMDQRRRTDTERSSSPPAQEHKRRTRFFHRQRKQGPNDARGGRPDRKSRNYIENKENRPDQDRPVRRVQRRFYTKPRPPVDFSVKVGNIGSTMRVRDLKAALQEKGVRPRDITWKGARGFAFLHFAKDAEQPEKPTAVDDVIASLQGLKVKCQHEDGKEETILSVEPAKPISRIENAGVTSV